MPKLNSVVDYINKREYCAQISRRLQRDLHVTDNLINRLGLEKELEGHSGCVNCLEWDSKGKYLASASDDLQIIIWDPFLYKSLQTFHTGHHGNIFSVKFMGGGKEDTVVTGAGDFEVRVHNIVCKETTRVCVCHHNRVKRLATTPDQPDIFWSAAEDGVIRQFDLRLPHTCMRAEKNVLVDLRTYTGEYIEAKCLSVNPLRTELIAVGANDPFIRIYDRRMIKLVKGPILSSSHGLSSTDDKLPYGCVQYFVPGHVSFKNKKWGRDSWEYNATYLTFSPNGTNLLVNLGSEQIYLFDITAKSQNLLLRRTYCNRSRQLGEPLSGYCNGFHPERSKSNEKPVLLPEHINKLKLAGNDYFEKELFTKSIHIYNEAIHKFPNSSVFYSNRAAAYMKRDWCGDMYAALRDCLTALFHDPSNVKAFFRMSRCLYELAWHPEALKCLENFKKRFPGYSKSAACVALERDISSKIKRMSETHYEEEESKYEPFLSGKETDWRDSARDYMLRFYGHCNTTTDIKEANFFGSNGQYIVAGSDDGSIFVWDSETTNNVRILKGDSSVVNCLQPHPTYCLLATSGIEHVVRLWSPKPQDGKENELEVKEREEVAQSNQRRMRADPFDVVLMNMGFSRPSSDSDSHPTTYNCRPS